MTFPEQAKTNEWRRLASASSVADALAERVGGLEQVRAEDLPAWLTGLGVPPGWRIAHLDDTSGVAPSRIAVCGATPRGGWEGCETITVSQFTGMPDVDAVRDNADCTLLDLDAEAVTTRLLATPPTDGAIAMRSSGYFSTAGQRTWAQFSTYLAGSQHVGCGRLIQHSVFVESRARPQLNDDIRRLSDAIHHAFASTVLTALGPRRNSG